MLNIFVAVFQRDEAFLRSVCCDWRCPQMWNAGLGCLFDHVIVGGQRSFRESSCVLAYSSSLTPPSDTFEPLAQPGNASLEAGGSAGGILMTN